MKTPTDSADAAWMLKARTGDRESFGLIFERYKNPVMGYLKTILQDDRIAEELTQETFLRAFRARESYEPKAKVSTWLFTIARNAAFDYRAKKKEYVLQSFENEEGDEFDPIDQLESPTPDSETQLLNETDRKRVENCLAELPEKQREVVSLRIFSDLSYEEIAREVQLPLGSVKTQLFRAKEKLIACFRKGGHE